MPHKQAPVHSSAFGFSTIQPPKLDGRKGEKKKDGSLLLKALAQKDVGD